MTSPKVAGSRSAATPTRRRCRPPSSSRADPPRADLQQLAPGRRARSRETARAHAHDRGEIVRGGELDQLPLHPQLAEEDDPSRPARAERRERAPGPPVGLRVAAGIEGQAEAVDPEAALALRQRGERPVQRLLARGEGPAEHREEQREGQRDPADEQRRAQRLRAKPRGGDRQTERGSRSATPAVADYRCRGLACKRGPAAALRRAEGRARAAPAGAAVREQRRPPQRGRVAARLAGGARARRASSSARGSSARRSAPWCSRTTGPRRTRARWTS